MYREPGATSFARHSATHTTPVEQKSVIAPGLSPDRRRAIMLARGWASGPDGRRWARRVECDCMPAASASTSRAPRRSQASAASRARSGAAPRTGSAAVLPRIRWDRVGRIAMLCVVAALAYLYLSAGLRLLSSWRESGRDSAQVHQLEAQNQILRKEHAALASPGTVPEEARRLGMMRQGEQVYSVSGLPAN